MRTRRIQPATGPLNASVRIPGSKSITNRAMVIGALAGGVTTLDGALFSDDTEFMIDALRDLGVSLTADRDNHRIRIEGCGGHLPATEADLYCGNSGTTIRFLAAVCALGMGPYRLDGNDRMRQRPIGPLIDALRSAGVIAGYDEQEGYPPITIREGMMRGATIGMDSPPSSQYVSALLMAAPCARGDVMIDVRGEVVSAPYLTMTTGLMDAFGVSVIEDVKPTGAKLIIPAPQNYAGRDYTVEPDASNASYFLAASAIAGGAVTVEGLGQSSIQGDVGFVDVLERMGCTVECEPNSLTVIGPQASSRLRGIDVDLQNMPDVAQTLAVVALFADSPTNIRNVANLRIKETDRIAALAAELAKFGATVEERDDGWRIEPPAEPTPAAVDTYDDHRMAMSFALAGLRIEGVEIRDPQCVNKTFPDFFDRFERLTDSGPSI